MKMLKTILTATMLVLLGTVAISCGGGGLTPPVGNTPPPPIDPPKPPVDPTLPGIPIDDPIIIADPDDPGLTPNTSPDLDGDGIPNDEDPDADGDGFLGAEDDCSDLDATTYPSALDKPDYPDYTDNNCDGIDGDADTAIWVSLDGSVAGPGTISEPFNSIQLAIAAANQDLTDIRDVYVVGGLYEEDVYILHGVGVYGGYGKLTEEGTRKRDIGENLTQVTAQTLPFGIGITLSGIEAVVEGFTIRGQADVPAFYVNDSSPAIRHNKIYSTTSDKCFISTGLYLATFTEGATTAPVITDNLIESADCLFGNSNSVAVMAIAMGKDSYVGPTLLGNDIRGGRAGWLSMGINVFSSAPGSRSTLVASKNLVSLSGESFFSSGINLGFSGNVIPALGFTSATLSQNEISIGRGSTFGYGVFMIAASDVVDIVNNFITGGIDSDQFSIGVFVFSTKAKIFNNTINAGTSDTQSAALILDIQSSAKIDNNIFYGKGKHSYGIMEPWNAVTVESLQNNLFSKSIKTDYYDFETGNIRNIDDVNGLQDVALIGGNIEGDPSFVDLDGMDYHLAPNSDAIDAGLMIEEIGKDIDDDSRFFAEAFDIGADEFTGTAVVDDTQDEPVTDEDEDEDEDEDDMWVR